MKLRRFNEKGLREMSGFLDSLISESPQPYPANLLTAPESTEPILPEVEIESRPFSTRFEAAEYFHALFATAGLSDVRSDRGLWAWLALLYFDVLCPPRRAGTRDPGAMARWILELGWRRYYRHLLAGPYFIFRAHMDDPKRALALLCGPLHKPGEVVEQLASRQEIVTNKAIVQMATALYIEPSSQRLRRGASGKSSGCARRLADVLNQYDLTWDLYFMSVPELTGMLPGEFGRFLRVSGS